MNLSGCVKLVFLGLLVTLVSSCGTCPKLGYDGNLKADDLALIQAKVAAKKIDLSSEKPQVLAEKSVFAPFLYFGGRGIMIQNDEQINVAGTAQTLGPYMYVDAALVGFPATVWMGGYRKCFSDAGEELTRTSHYGLLMGVLGGGGSFRFKSRNQVAEKIGPTGIWTGLGFITGWLYPSRWFFTGTEGYYWNAPLWLFGYVSSDTSKTLNLLGGWIPIRFSNTEKPGNI